MHPFRSWLRVSRQRPRGGEGSPGFILAIHVSLARVYPGHSCLPRPSGFKVQVKGGASRGRRAGLPLAILQGLGPWCSINVRFTMVVRTFKF